MVIEETHVLLLFFRVENCISFQATAGAPRALPESEIKHLNIQREDQTRVAIETAR